MSRLTDFTSSSYLKDIYLNRKLSTYKTGALLHCDPKTVFYWLRKHNIPTRPIYKGEITANILFNLYINKKLSLKKIGKMYKMSSAGILKRMKKLNIPRRTSWEANTSAKIPFCGPIKEKAYLIGFRIGDLGVRTPSKVTQSVLVGSNTTKNDQATLIKNLFKKYSKVWISKSKNGIISISALLHKSFNFLVPKKDCIEKWILKNRNLMLFFMAGYIDAEGSFGVYDNRGKFRIGSYDKNILASMSGFLNKNNIKNILNLERKLGKKQNGDFWRLTINDGYSLFKFHNLIADKIRHNKRKADFQLVIENIHSRLYNGTIHVGV